MKGMSMEMRIPTVGAAASLAAARKALMARRQKTGKKVRPLAFFFFFSVPVNSPWLFSRDNVVYWGGPVRCRPLPMRRVSRLTKTRWATTVSLLFRWMLI